MRLTFNTPTVFGGLIAALLAGAFYGSGAAAAEEAAAGEGGKPYTVNEKGEVDEKTFIGWRTFNGNCARCHGETATGSTFAPSLITRMKDMPQIVFEQVVTNGLKGQMGVMPAFGNDGNVTPYMDELWAYLSALQDEAIPPGRPAEMEDKDELPEYLREKQGG